MENKIIRTTHIDNGAHGYLSVSKKDFIRAGGDPTKISSCSGHTLTRMYLEEDGDQNYFWDLATANGFKIVRKSGYNLRFQITHGFDSKLFDYNPEVGDVINNEYTITTIDERGIYIRQKNTGMTYRIGYNNPFQYIITVTKVHAVVETAHA